MKMIAMDGSELKVVAGNGEEGERDGTNASFSQLMGIDVEYGKNILVAGPQIGAIRLITKFLGGIRFLENLGQLFRGVIISTSRAKFYPFLKQMIL